MKNYSVKTINGIAAGETGNIELGITGITGPTGPTGTQGVPGETLSPKGVILDYTTLIGLTGMSPLDTYILQSTAELYVYDPTAGIPPADSYGWVNMGAIQGPPGATGIQGPTGTIGPVGATGPAGLTNNVFFNIGTTISATNSTSSIYRTGSINIGSGTATNGRFVVSSSGGTTSLVVDDSGNVYNIVRGTSNTLFGLNALLNNTSGTNNTAIGNSTLQANTAGNQQIAIGSGALQNNTSGTQNIAIGNSSLQTNTTGSSNTAIGLLSMWQNTTGTQNVALGFQSLRSNTTGFYNTAIGYNALFSGTNSSYNTAIGYHSLSRGLFASSAFSGSFNTAVGFQSLLNNITGNSNTAIGERSLSGTTTGNLNTAIGSTSLLQNTTGNFNIALGASAGNVTKSGSFATNSNNSLFIGYDTRPQLDNQTNQIVMGHGTIGNGSNSVTLGNDSINKTILKGNIGIGLTGPSTNLHVYGTQSGAFRLEDGTQGNGYVLTSDVNGVASWTSFTSSVGVNNSFYIQGGLTPSNDILSNIYRTGGISIGSSASVNSRFLVSSTMSILLMSVHNDGKVSVGPTFSTSFTELLQVNGSVTINGSYRTTNGRFAFSDGSSGMLSPNGSNIVFQSYSYNPINDIFKFDPIYVSSINPTDNLINRVIVQEYNITATSGKTQVRMIDLSPTINKTGTASGIDRGIYINPTLINDINKFRSIEVTNGDVLFSTNGGNVGVGLTAPSTKLHVYSTQSGAFRLQDGTEGINKILISDFNGVGSWTSSLTGLSLLGNSEVISASVSATASLVVYDYNSSSIFYHATASSNFTANFTNLPTTDNRVLTATIVISQGVSAYIPNVVQIAGVTQSIKWAGGTQSGTANSLDLISFNFIRTGNTWTNVIGQIAPFF